MPIAKTRDSKLLEQADTKSSPDPKNELANADLKPTEAIRELFTLLHKSTGFKRLLFLKREHGALHSSITLGVDADSELNDVHLPIAKQQLFYELMRKPKTVWLDKASQARFSILLNKNFQQLFDSDNYCCASMFHGPRGLGLVFADKILDGLSESIFQKFTEACELANQSMTREFEKKVK